MAVYARIDDGVVAELVNTDADISTLYTPELVATMVPATNDVRQGWTWNGAQFAAPVIPTPTVDEELVSRTAAGLKLTSQATAAFNGTFAIDADAQQQIAGIIALIGAGGTLPASPMPFPDINGQPHNFTAQQLITLASALSSYVFALRQSWGAQKQGFPVPWPPQSVALD